MSSRWCLIVNLLLLCLDRGGRDPGTFLGSSSIRVLRDKPGAQICRALPRATVLCSCSLAVVDLLLTLPVRASVRIEGKGYAEVFPFPFSTEESQPDAEWEVSQDLESWEQSIPDSLN